ncbi:MAG: hypothetical protein IKI50_06260 [Clostridia bacterium]|nr:hypothetical protein [Clostridia bacterium]
MKRLSLFLLCAVLLCAGLCGCGSAPAASGDDTTPTTTSATAQEEAHLPGFDADTVLLTIDFPDDFPMELYTEKALTVPQDFAWGQYVPFVQCHGTNYYNSSPLYYEGAFLTSNCTSLEDACLLYDKLNDRYLTETQVIDRPFGAIQSLTQFSATTLLGRPMLADMLFRSHVVALSPDLRHVGTASFVFQGDAQTADLAVAGVWQNQYDIYTDGVLTHSESEPNEQSDLFVNLFCHNYYETYFLIHPTFTADDIPASLKQADHNSILTTSDEQTAVYAYADKYGIYTVTGMKMLYEITTAREISAKQGREVRIVQVVQGRYLLLWVSVGTNEPFIYYDSVYLYDLQTGTMTLLEKYAYQPSLSPDGKYLAYTAPFGEDTGIQNGEAITMARGYYIKNLENGTTTFFTDDKQGLPCGWVDEQILLQTIG